MQKIPRRNSRIMHYFCSREHDNLNFTVMKKVLYGIFSLTIVASAFLLNSCDSKIVSSEKKITNTATLIINTGIEVESSKDAIPMSGQATIVLITTDEVVGGDGTGKYIQYVTLSGEQLTTQVPVIAGQAVDYSVTYPEFVAPYTVSGTTEEYMFTGTLTSGDLTGLVPGDVRVLGIRYSGAAKTKVK
jgi:hypothetical protein